MLAEKDSSVDDWVDFLGKDHMPALAETVQKLNKLTTDDDSRVSQLTEQILKDPSLTSRVLQVSNSVVYKGLGGNIKTITRAIVMLGFTTIRDISLSMQILDNILKHNPSEHLMVQIANSYHAAMQAKGLLREFKAASQEEIFISTLLLHFAEMSMMSRDDEVSRQLNAMLNRENCTPNQAATEILGCSFDQISIALAQQWELGEVLLEALKRPAHPSKPAQAVMLGDELSQVALLGWNSEPVKAVIKKIAKYRDVSFKEALEEVKQMASVAHELAVHYGAAKVRHLIPNAETESAIPVEASKRKQEQIARANNNVKTVDRAGGVTVESIESTSEKVEKRLTDAEEGIEDLIEMALSGADGLGEEPTERTRKIQSGVENVQLQMDIMQKLNLLIAEKRMDVNAMLDLVLEGMCSAIGMERVVMGLVSRDRKRMMPKFFKGEVTQEFREKFVINLNEENSFSAAILQSQQFWIGSKMMAGRFYLHTKQLQEALGYGEYFVAPIVVSRRPIGIFYGDQAVSGTPLNDQQYAGFNMLAQQAGLALTANQN